MGFVLGALVASCSGAAQLLVRGAGQTSHQSVSKPFQGELRSTVQSKAFGAGIASVSDSPNRLHGARGVIAHPVSHAIAHPVAHAVAPLAVAHAAPLAVAHAAPIAVAHPTVAVAHPTAYASGDALAEVSPYNFNYAVADDYSGSSFTASENSDGLGVKQGSYQVALPDGRTQTVTYTTDDVNGYVADVSYEGVPQYPEAVPVVAQAAPLLVKRPVTAAAPLAVAHAAPVAVAHAAPLVAKAVVPAPAVAHPAPAHPIQG